MVVCNCIYCGRELEVPEGIVFDGPISEAIKHIDSLPAKKSESCPCRLQRGDANEDTNS
ncbi:MAG: hypothetical protein RR370_03235 [Synergistaceae bacterium]